MLGGSVRTDTTPGSFRKVRTDTTPGSFRKVTEQDDNRISLAHLVLLLCDSWAEQEQKPEEAHRKPVGQNPQEMLSNIFSAGPKLQMPPIPPMQLPPLPFQTPAAPPRYTCRVEEC